MNRTAGIVATLLVLIASSAVELRAEEHHFAVARRIAIGGVGGWDCLTVDTKARRLYVTHGTQVEVVDLDKGTVAGVIPNTPGVHGVAIVREAGRGFTTNGRDSSVTVFDLNTLAPLDRIKLQAQNPDIIAYDPVSGRVFTMNAGSDNATAIDARSDKIVGTVALGGRPEFAVPDGAGKMYVNLEDSSAVVVFDTRTLKVLDLWPLAPGEEPTGLALDAKHHRLFAGCANQKLVVLDAVSGRVVATVPIGKGCDGVAFDSKRQLVFSPNGGDSTMTVIHEDAPDHYTVVENVPTQRGARTLAFDEKSGSVYTVTAKFGPPPAPTAERPHPRGSVLPGTFEVLEVRR